MYIVAPLERACALFGAAVDSPAFGAAALAALANLGEHQIMDARAPAHRARQALPPGAELITSSAEWRVEVDGVKVASLRAMQSTGWMFQTHTPDAEARVDRARGVYIPEAEPQATNDAQVGGDTHVHRDDIPASEAAKYALTDELVARVRDKMSKRPITWSAAVRECRAEDAREATVDKLAALEDTHVRRGESATWTRSVEAVRGLSSRRAIRAWCAAAGTAGAFVPAELAQLATAEVDVDALHLLVEEAERRAEDSNTGPVPCKVPDLTPTGIVWCSDTTEVRLELEPAGWTVRLSRPHPGRSNAMLSALARMDAEDQRSDALREALREAASSETPTPPARPIAPASQEDEDMVTTTDGVNYGEAKAPEPEDKIDPTLRALLDAGVDAASSGALLLAQDAVAEIGATLLADLGVFHAEVPALRGWRSWWPWARATAAPAALTAAEILRSPRGRRLAGLVGATVLHGSLTHGPGRRLPGAEIGVRAARLAMRANALLLVTDALPNVGDLWAKGLAAAQGLIAAGRVAQSMGMLSTGDTAEVVAETRQAERVRR